MSYTVILFAALKDSIKKDQLILEWKQDTINGHELKQHLIQEFPALKAVIESSYIAKNQAYAHDEERLQPTDEIALIPPVSGGSGSEDHPQHTELEQRYEITHDHIDIQEVMNKVHHPDHGAQLCFTGTTREHTSGKRTTLLQYEAYVPMALRELEQIGLDIASKWPGTLTAITHRLGEVAIGEASVVIAVSAPHRNDAYEANRFAIEQLKLKVPIWKKEIWEDGSEWKGAQSGPWNPMQQT
ncbi:molybdenum cofactor biosynthesis protein [Longirhabdus pacifica]|uniref:molybdenum cofactor biosynthesis protein n=1 Tax=Longirhabdus pacifica TaxID=2305227 RepID=UPI0010090B2A|nr:molybdenum cofactor biosynthesis protein MoaE [Longirhabdus pacifica]